MSPSSLGPSRSSPPPSRSSRCVAACAPSARARSPSRADRAYFLARPQAGADDKSLAVNYVAADLSSSAGAQAAIEQAIARKPFNGEMAGAVFMCAGVRPSCVPAPSLVALKLTPELRSLSRSRCRATF